jgi:two-component system NtrC family sensor kinase
LTTERHTNIGKRKNISTFFNTKPTGKGTGLGLSLSYEIITKGHNGKLIFESIMNEGTTFIIKISSSTV